MTDEKEKTAFEAVHEALLSMYGGDEELMKEMEAPGEPVCEDWETVWRLASGSDSADLPDDAERNFGIFETHFGFDEAHASKEDRHRAGVAEMARRMGMPDGFETVNDWVMALLIHRLAMASFVTDVDDYGRDRTSEPQWWRMACAWRAAQVAEEGGMQV